MLNGQTFYHGILRKTIIAFGHLFSNIKIERQSKDGEQTVMQVITVPLAYAPKEKWIVRIDSDPELTTHTYTTLPRLSFEITGYTYDSTRKVNRMNKIGCQKDDASRNWMNSPAPYNVDISLYVLTKTQEDAMQIIEQILPTFTPEYTLAINAVPEMNVVQDVPIILNSITVQDDYDGDFQTRRFVTHTLNFTLKINMFGGISNQSLIDTVMVNVTQAKYTATGTLPGNPITEEWIEGL